MSKFKPGEFRITDKAMERWDLPKGSAVLDIGCGCGETLEHLEEKYGYQGKGIDLSLARINEGKKRNPSLDLEYGDGEFLNEFTSFTFNGILMECVLSVINKPDEALHEAYCVLKKGGKLFISDLYIKNPDSEFIRQLEQDVEKQPKHNHDDDGCNERCEEDHKNKLVNFRSDGRFLMDPMVRVLEEMGYENILWEDCTLELDQYVAEKLLADGTLAGCLCEGSLNPKDDYKTGYMMLTAEKPCEK